MVSNKTKDLGEGGREGGSMNVYKKTLVSVGSTSEEIRSRSPDTAAYKMSDLWGQVGHRLTSSFLLNTYITLIGEKGKGMYPLIPPKE